MRVQPGSVLGSRTRAPALALCLVMLLILPRVSSGQSSSKPPEANFGLLRDAAELIARGDLSRAETEIQFVLRQTPNSSRALNLLGIVRAQQHRNSEAEALFKKALQIDPGFASACVDLGLLYAQSDRGDDAIAQFRQALKLDPQRHDAANALLGVYRTQARAAVQAGNDEKALSLLIEARKIAPQDPDTLFDFGMVALRMSLLQDAVQALQQELTLRKDDAPAIYALGRAEIGMSNFEDARVQFQRYVQLRPQDASGHYALGLTLASLQQDPAARREFEESVKLDPAQTESYFRLGLLDLDQNELDRAAARFHFVLQRNPRHAGALTGMGRVDLNLKQYQAAANLLQQAADIDPGLREAHYYLGLTYARLGRTKESEQELQIATRINQEEVKKHQFGLRLMPPDAGSGNAGPP